MIFDAHGDIWTDVTQRITRDGEHDVFRKHHLQKFRDGGVTGSIFVIWVDPPFDTDPVGRMKTVIESIKDEKKHASDIINFVEKYDDFGIAPGKIDVVNGIEGLSGIAGDIDQIDMLYNEMGVRHCMLSWNEQNELATGWPQDVNRGLTDLGRAAVKKIQNLGMVMDVSHLNDRSFWDVINVNQGKPIIASHSNARSVCSHMRNLSDDMIKALAETDGVIGMNSFKEFISSKSEDQNVERLVDHIDYIANLVGVEHVGLGFDFDDYLEGETLEAFSENADSPSGVGIANESEASNVLKIMRQRGYTESEIKSVAYGNFHRVFKECWK